ncbi:MAG: glycosyltransferase family 2 protein [Leuconostoc mesenteroides]|uniref:glycosyltransferase family 2 protein n=1 Tax=Leuconostoc mesenteroides TaxID=1245 RepID=UPI000FFCD901|nr:glycosyltransferase family 2 protein [Leuconostoc mesenteroides]QAR69492.1 glycosyltransferase family 2 protein [Leuconostoc mesenteroides]WJM73777.1 glycosyltransferase family 2 protein [Leuconostoc mesenteroides]
MEEIKISVIMPVYNVARYLRRSIDSVLKQTFKGFELILVDDGSTDASPSILDEYKENPRVNVIHKKNSGSGLSRNVGLDVAKGQYVYFMDPDDWLEGEMLRDNYELIRKASPDILLFGSYDHLENRVTSQNLDNEFLQSKKSFLERLPQLFKKNVMYTVWNKIYKKSFLLNFNLRFGSERSGQDYVFNIKVYDKVNTMLVTNKKYYHYVIQRKDSATTNFRKDMFDLYRHEQIELINFIEKNNIRAKDIINDRWYFILNNSWRRALSQKNLRKSNAYTKTILREYSKNKYIHIKHLSKFKWKIKYLLFFKSHIYMLYKNW